MASAKSIGKRAARPTQRAARPTQRAARPTQQTLKSFFGGRGNKQRKHITDIAKVLGIPLRSTIRGQLDNIYKHTDSLESEEKKRELEGWIISKIESYKNQELRDTHQQAVNPSGVTKYPIANNLNTSFAFSTPTSQPLDQARSPPNTHIHSISCSQELFTQEQRLPANVDGDQSDLVRNPDIFLDDYVDEESTDTEELTEASLSAREDSNQNIKVASAGVPSTGRSDVLSRTLPPIPSEAGQMRGDLKVLIERMENSTDRYDQMVSVIAPAVESKDRQIALMGTQIEELKEINAHKDRQMEHKDKQIERIEKCNADKDKQLQHKDKLIEKLVEGCSSKEWQVTMLQGAIKEQIRQTAEIFEKARAGNAENAEVLKEVRNVILSAVPDLVSPKPNQPINQPTANQPISLQPTNNQQSTNNQPTNQPTASVATGTRMRTSPPPQSAGNPIPPLLSGVLPPSLHGPSGGQPSDLAQPCYPSIPAGNRENHRETHRETHGLNKETITLAQRKKNGTVLVIADSNGQHLDDNRLHDHKEVLIERRYTLEDAEEIPSVPYPENVTDVVMLTAVNNINRPNASVPLTVDKFDRVCQLYSRRFPNARIHVGCVAPSNDKHIQLNAGLLQLAIAREAPAISTEAMYDQKSGKPRQNLYKPDRIHFTQAGIGVLAKQIKKSLYSKSPRTRPPPPMHRLMTPFPSSGPPSHPAASIPSYRRVTPTPTPNPHRSLSNPLWRVHAIPTAPPNPYLSPNYPPQSGHQGPPYAGPNNDLSRTRQALLIALDSLDSLPVQ